MPAPEEARRLAEKKSLIACERSRPDIARERLNFMIARRFENPESLVFLDESGTEMNITGRYGRAPAVERCNFAAAHGHWKTTTMISAMRASGVIKEATLLIDGAMNGATFLGYIRRCQAPTLRAGRAFRAVTARGCANYFRAAGHGTYKCKML